MELLANDLSFHGQFSDITTFHQAFKRLMILQRIARSFGRELHCHRDITSSYVMPNMTIQQAIQKLSRDECRSAMGWLTKYGPFWEKERNHGPDDYLECNGEIVTDTAVGEAAYCCLHRIDRVLVSLIPSSWDFSPVMVKWYRDDADVQKVDVLNYRTPQELESALRSAPAAITSWEALKQFSVSHCPHLIFSPNCFNSLRGHPFVKGAAHRVLSLLKALDLIKSYADAGERGTSDWNSLYQDYFTGAKAWFSDSSDTEKVEFQTELTFPHPTNVQNKLFCPWHGKVNNRPPLRIHFSWPLRVSEPLYVVYVGPKLTRR